MDKKEKLLKALQMEIETFEKRTLEQFGMSLYKSTEGFTQEQIYEYAGAEDRVATLRFRPNSESANLYGSLLTVVFVYTIKERKAFENDITSLNNKKNVKAKNLLKELDETLFAKLLNEGIPTLDIIEMTVAPATKSNNTFSSKELRTPNVLYIPVHSCSNGKDILWMYGGLRRIIADGTAITPEERARYLAYKIILEPQKLSDTEKNEMSSPEVAYYILTWKETANRLSEMDKNLLIQLRTNRVNKRLELVEKELQNMGLSLAKLSEKYPQQKQLLLEKVINFSEKRYNLAGKHLLYMSFESFLHIYLRHVKELTVDNQFSERSKFQLAEKDIEATMDIVLHAINDEYQKYKEANPSKNFYRKGSKAYYYNGDYYDIYIKPDGQISTFYKKGM